MKTKVWQISAVAILSALGVPTASARPIEFSEVSLLVRSHESNPEILDQVRTRKLLHPLNAQQEDLLKQEGANDELIRGLRDSRFALSAAEANAFGAEEQRIAAHRHDTRERHEENASVPDNVRIFDVPTVTPSISASGADLITMSFSNAAVSLAKTSLSRI
jgi:hypothetical protein